MIERAGRAGRAVDFVDVGANVGQFCVRLNRRDPAVDLRTWAFEPVPQNFALLRRNLARNRVTRTEVFMVALSDRDGQMPMRFDQTQAGDAALLTEATPTSIAVTVGRGDHWLADLRPGAVRLIKIDVEGHEVEVLRGLRQTLGRADFTTVVCIEDIFHREQIHAELTGLGFGFDRKLTPYNSWYVRGPRI